MEFEKTVQSIHSSCPELFQKRWQVLEQLFCIDGNGYLWMNGELIESGGDKDRLPSFVIKLDENGKARFDERSDEEKIKAKFKELMMEKELFEEQLRSAGISEELFREEFHKDEEQLMKRAERYVRDRKVEKMAVSSLSPDALLFEVPDDVMPDWLEGVRETVLLLLENGFEGPSREKNEWEKEQVRLTRQEMNKLVQKLNVKIK